MLAWDQLDDAALWLTAVVAGLGALAWLARKVWHAIQWANDLGETIDAVHRLADHELSPNSGSSMKDALARIEEELGIVKASQRATDGRLTDHLAQSSQMVLQMQRAHVTLERRTEAAEKRDAELVDTITSLAQTLPIVAASTPPEET